MFAQSRDPAMRKVYRFAEASTTSTRDPVKSHELEKL
jgi:hypothetical protein